MDTLVVKAEKGSSAESAAAADAAAASDAATSLQQFLANSGALMQLLPQGSDGSSAATAGSLPWMTMSPYQMMVLPQSFLASQNASGANPQDAAANYLLAAAASGGDAQNMKVEKSSSSTPGSQSVAALLQKRDSIGTTAVQQAAAMQVASVLDGMAQSPHSQPSAAGDANSLKPPKKPLTPYMTFSKMIWPRVKAAHPHLSSVCELGAVVGSLWRDLDPVEKQQYNEQFTREKWIYDEELRNYLKVTGLTASDLIKPKVKRTNPRDRSTANQSHHAAASRPAATGAVPNGNAHAATTAGQQLVESLLGNAQTANGGLTSPGSAAMPDGWSNQAAQQLLASLGISGQTLYANSDGTISVDGSLLTIGGRPVQLAAGQVPGSDQPQQQQMMQTENPATSTSGGWTWHQPSAGTSSASSAQQQAADAAASGGMVLYQLLSNGSIGPVVDGNVATSTASGGSGAGQLFYSVDQYGQLVAHEAKASPRQQQQQQQTTTANESSYQQHISLLRRALDEKTAEADTLRAQLTEVYASIERYKSNGSGGASNGGDGPNGREHDMSNTPGSAIKIE